MLDAHSETRLSQVYPVLADKIRKLYDMLLVEGITIVVVQGLRTIDEQNALFAQGRSTPGKIVTNARGGQSWHNYGCAVDCAIQNLDRSIDWNASHPSWKRMEEVGVSLGMTSGANWKRIVDAPHFQITGRFPEGAPDAEVQQLLQENGIQAVWDAITGN